MPAGKSRATPRVRSLVIRIERFDPDSRQPRSFVVIPQREVQVRALVRQPVHSQVLGPESVARAGRRGGRLDGVPSAPVARVRDLRAKARDVAEVVVGVLENLVRRARVPQRALVPVPQQPRGVEPRPERVRVLGVEDEVQSLHPLRHPGRDSPLDRVRIRRFVVPRHPARLPGELPVAREVSRRRSAPVPARRSRREPLLRSLEFQLGIVKELQRGALRRPRRDLGGGRADEVSRLVLRGRDPVERGSRRGRVPRSSVEPARSCHQSLRHGSGVSRVGPRARRARGKDAGVVRIEPRHRLVRGVVVVAGGARGLVPDRSRGGRRRARVPRRGGRARAMGRTCASAERPGPFADGARAELRR